MQCLHKVLKSERPDIDEKRNDLLKLQGEFAVRLRQLEKALLAALNESKGKILDDNSVIATLEKLKNEAKEVARKAAETDHVMKEVEIVSQKYVNLAHACSLIYLTLHHLDEVHFLYHYSLDFIIDIFDNVLKTSRLNDVADHEKRLDIITNTLFQVSFRTISCYSNKYFRWFIVECPKVCSIPTKPCLHYFCFAYISSVIQKKPHMKLNSIIFYYDLSYSCRMLPNLFMKQRKSIPYLHLLMNRSSLLCNWLVYPSLKTLSEKLKRYPILVYG